MNIDFYLHGTPLGQDVYSTCKTEDLYVLSFYGLNLEDSSMVVETKVFNNRIYCYYTYYRKHIFDINHKEGYCAITLKSDCFINCIKTIYHILDICFEQHVMGTYISSGKHNQFTVDSIHSKESKVFDYLASLLSQTLKNDNIIKLDDSFIANAKPQLIVHPSNIHTNDILSTYKTVERLIVSPNATSDKEEIMSKDFQSKLKYVKHEAERKVKEAEDRIKQEAERNHQYIHDLQLENKKLQASYERLQQNETTNKKLVHECHMLQSKLEDCRISNKECEAKMRSLSSVNQQQKSKLEELARILRDIHPVRPEPISKAISSREESYDRSYIQGRMKLVFELTRIVLTVILIGLVIGLYFRDEISQMQSFQEETVLNTKEDMTSNGEDIAENVSITKDEYPKSLMKDVHIDIKNLRYGVLDIDTEYYLSVVGFEMPQDVIWRVQGECDFDGKETFKVVGGSSVIIQCVYQNTIIAERTVKVSQKLDEPTNIPIKEPRKQDNITLSQKKKVLYKDKKYEQNN